MILMKEYDELIQAEKALRVAIDNGVPENLKKLASEVESLERDYIESQMVFGGESLKIDITEQNDFRLSSSIIGMPPELASIHREQCKKLARKLYASTHPDKGGSSEEFDRVRKAAMTYDLEYLYLKSLDVDRKDLMSEETLRNRIRARWSKMIASPVSRIARLKLCNSPDFEPELEAYLNNRKFQLTQLLIQPKGNNHAD